MLHRASNQAKQARLATIPYHSWDRADPRKGS